MEKKQKPRRESVLIPSLTVIPYNILKRQSKDELLETAAGMLKYLDPPAEAGKWAIALVNFQAIDEILSQRGEL